MRANCMLAVLVLLAGCGGSNPGSDTGGNGGSAGSGGSSGGGAGGSGGAGSQDLASPSSNGSLDMATPPDMVATTACQYPAGPYALAKGKTIDPSISWQCVKAGETTAKTMSTKDFFDCDGSRKINAVLFDTSATWCGPCNDEADMEEANWTARWMKEGVVVVTLMAEGAVQNQPATLQTALDWIKAHKLMHGYVCVDPQYTVTPPTGCDAIPCNVIVDPRKMTIADYMAGWDPADRTLDKLAMSNAH